jgi:diguanylate cyclase (GGDEF)-like protein
MSATAAADLNRWARLDHLIGARARVLMFSAVLATVGLVGYVLVVPNLDAPAVPLTIPWPIFALFYFFAEAKVIDVHYRGGTHTFSLTEVPAVIGLFFVDPQFYVIGLVVGASAALLRARQPVPKFCFNLSLFLVGSVASLAIFHAISSFGGPLTSPGPIQWLAAFAAMLSVSTISAVAIATVITLSGGTEQFRRLPEAMQVGALFAVTNTALALLAVEILWTKAGAVWLVAVPVATLFIAYRAYLSERQKHESLEFLYESSQIFQRSPELSSAIVALLEHARLMFRTDRAEMILVGEEGGVPYRTTAGPGSTTEVMAEATDRTGILARLEQDPKPFIYDAHEDLPGTPDRLFQYAMVCPLRGESGIIGAMLVADRVGDNDGFGPDQLRMLETVANQAAVTLENGQLEQSLAELSRLKEELRHQAFHDPLTGLANRALFVQALEDRLKAGPTVKPESDDSRLDRRSPAEGEPVVLFLDLDDFKVVNDTVGHAAGDRVLKSVADRLVAAIRDDDIAARLGGDEFAIMFAHSPDIARATLVADRIAALLQRPFTLGGREFAIGASVGLAVGRPGQGARELLQNADVAMYTAKAEGKRQLAVWNPEMNDIVVERHTLTTELGHAIEAGELRVAYQPLIGLDGRGVTGFEALARWDHPTRGPIDPQTFIRLAENSGTIVALGRSVLVEACRQAAQWKRDPSFESMTLNVNLSSYQVHGADFADDVLSILAEADLAPHQLVLEMTETAMFRDVDATIGKLQALRQHGVRIAVDDFGTGYSSLSWIRQFPVDILKLARDFVVDGDADDSDWAFAHAIVMMGRTLGLEIVAEGIETPRQHERLAALGCDYGQGFLFGRATYAERLPALVKEIDAQFAQQPVATVRA